MVAPSPIFVPQNQACLYTANDMLYHTDLTFADINKPADRTPLYEDTVISLTSLLQPSPPKTQHTSRTPFQRGQRTILPEYYKGRFPSTAFMSIHTHTSLHALRGQFLFSTMTFIRIERDRYVILASRTSNLGIGTRTPSEAAMGKRC